MIFPRRSSLVLAVGGSAWAFLLIMYAFGFLHYSAGAGVVWALIWLPGLFAWYGYIRRALGHFLFRRALITWLVSLVANVWSLFFIWVYFGGRSGRKMALLVCVAIAWIIIAIVVSVVCLILESKVREAQPDVVSQVSDEELKKLLDKHRSGQP